MQRRYAVALAAALGGVALLSLLILQVSNPASASEPPPSLAAGAGHSCAVRADSTVQCWGWNSSGQLGNGTTTDSSFPVDVCQPLFLAGAAGGAPPSCCPILLSASPAGVLPMPCGLSGIQQVVAGYSHTCALTGAGTVMCWGDNTAGQLGNGSFANSAYPTDVCASGPIVLSAGGGPVSCCPIVLSAWPDAVPQAPGAPAPMPQIPLPGCGTLSGVIQISASYGHTCALQEAGTIWCWGYNASGQLGNGSISNSSTPVQVCGGGPIVLSPSMAGVSCFPLTGAIAVSAGGEHTCALMNDSSVVCWGVNASGQLGDASTSDSLYPVSVCEEGFFLAGDGAGGSPSCCPIVLSGSPGGVLPSCYLTGATSISAGYQHTCAVMTDSSALCWGENGEGQLGNGTSFDAWGPMPVCQPFALAGAGGFSVCCPIVLSGGAAGVLPPCSTLSGVASISAGYQHTCTVMETSGVLCWGSGNSGKLGYGAKFGGSTAIAVCDAQPLILAGVLPPPCTPLSGATAVSSGWEHTCALIDDKRVLCWGGNTYGGLGNGTTSQHNVPGEVIGFGAKATPTPTSTPTHTPTSPPGATNTPAHTNTPPAGATNTPTHTNTPPASATNTPTRTNTPPPAATSTPPPGGLRGDVNCDGRVNAIDAAFILQLVAGLIGSVPCPENADVNGDGLINPIDSALILQYTAGLIPSL